MTCYMLLEREVGEARFRGERNAFVEYIKDESGWKSGTDPQSGASIFEKILDNQRIRIAYGFDDEVKDFACINIVAI